MSRSALRWTRRELLSAAVAGAASAAVACASLRAPRPRPPNLVLILADDFSARELGCYGNPEHRTPALDGLARTGVRFRTCWATPLCVPSRAEIMTGRYGFRTGWTANDPGPGVGGSLASAQPVFSQLLRLAGYRTAICGKWQLPGDEAEHGFDEHCMWAEFDSGRFAELLRGFDGPVERRGSQRGRTSRYWHPAIVRNGRLLPTGPDDYGPDLFADFLLDFATRESERPFLAYYPMCLPHRSFDFDSGARGWLPVPERDASGARTGGRVPGSLRSNVEYIDHLVGRIVDGLARAGLRDRTVVLFTSDNGTFGYGKGQWQQERGPRVPLLANGPGLVAPLGAADDLVDLSDLLPTLCDLAGAALPGDHRVDGRSFAPLLRGEPHESREWIFSYLGERRMLRDRRWLLDGAGRLWDCGGRRDERGYRDATDSTRADAVAARRRFAGLLERLPVPDAALSGLR